MSSTSISRLVRLAGKFRRDARGNVAIIFALASIPLVALVGAAVDYTRTVSARTALQTALDSAALMISKDAASMTASDITTRSRQYVDALYTHTEAPIKTFSATYTPNTGKGATILLNASGDMPTDFIKVLGSNFSTLPVATSSTTNWGSTRMRVAMVLDNTGSMADNGKMTALQSAATDMITKLSALSTTPGDLYISIVPFAKDVNVDTSSNLNATWLNWTEWKADPPYLRQNGYPNNLASLAGITTAGVWIDLIGPKSNCPFSSNSYGFSCTDRPATISGANSASKIPSSGNYNGMICPGIDSGSKLSGKYRIYYNGCYTSVPVTLKWTGSSASCSGKPSGCSCTGSGSNKVCSLAAFRHDWRNVPVDPSAIPAADPTLTKYAAPDPSASTANGGWAGCVNDRDQSYDTTNDAMSGSGTPSKLPYPEQWADCLPATITAMSNQWSNLKTQISNMSPSGNTNQAVGLFWGWQTLNTANAPYKAPAKDPNWVYKDYIVLLSDGLNTQNRWTQTVSDIDARQEILCKNIKDPTKNGGNQITVFSIQVNINSKDPTSKVLQDCATPGSGYFQIITAANQTAGAFDSILAQIAKLRISK